MKKLGFLLLFLLAAISACQLQKVTVKMYAPPGLLYPPEVKSFLVTSRYVPATGPYEDIQWGAYESVDSVKWVLAESMVDTLGRHMAEEGIFLVRIRHMPRMLRHNEGSLPDALPWNGMNDLAQKELVQAILVIEGFDIEQTPPSVIATADHTCIASFGMRVTMALRVYEPEKMRFLDDSVYTFSSRFESSGASEKEAIDNLPDPLKSSFAACANAAREYAAMIRPGAIVTKRDYYTGRDSSLMKAEQAFKSGKWGRAESGWKWLAYNSPDSLVQARASYNMALACERDGRYNQAIGYARRSERLHPSRKTRDYIGLLEGKILDLEKQVHLGERIKKW